MRVRHRYESGMVIREGDGRDDAPPILYIHGLGESGLCFECLVHPH